METRPRLVIDKDGTLFDTLTPVISLYNKTYNCKKILNDFKQWNTDKKLLEFFNIPETTYNSLPIVDSNLKIIKLNKLGYDIVFVTSVFPGMNHKVWKATIDLYDYYFGDIEFELHFTNSKCKIKGDYYIDDDINVLRNIKNECMLNPSMLFLHKQPWNINETEILSKDWNEIYRILEAMI
jgi:5'(3')-deoxyribonucleotidase